jgi:hypothetical protein
VAAVPAEVVVAAIVVALTICLQAAQTTQTRTYSPYSRTYSPYSRTYSSIIYYL